MYSMLELGKVYLHSNGYKYKCIKEDRFDCFLERLSDHSTLKAHGTKIKNGLISWDYSTDKNLFH